MTFNQFYDKINGKMYDGVPAPAQYNFLDYVKAVTSSNVNGTETGKHDLIPLNQEDMGRYAADDVIDHYHKLHNGKNSLSLGKPMTDLEFKKFLGHTWK
jgi:hypothetical protein